MNETETQIPRQDSDLQWQVAALQRQVFLQLLALVVVTATVVFYLYYQNHTLSRDLDQNRQQAMSVIDAYNRNQQMIKSFEAQLINYANTHPNFQPVLMKYGWRPGATPTK
jgi:hypothetical protein